MHHCVVDRSLLCGLMRIENLARGGFLAWTISMYSNHVLSSQGYGSGCIHINSLLNVSDSTNGHTQVGTSYGLLQSNHSGCMPLRKSHRLRSMDQHGFM